MQNLRRRMDPRPSSPEDPSICIKFSLFFLNVFFWLAAILILGVGVYMMVEKRDTHQNYLSHLEFNPAVLLLFLGAALFVITFLGCLGALRENTCMLCFYAIIVGFLLLAEMVCGALAFAYREKVQEGIGDRLKEAIDLYRDPSKPDLQLLIETTQTEFKCCGINSYEDWRSNIYFNCSSPGIEACGVPRTCCKTEEDRVNSQCGYGVGRMDAFEREDRIYTTGCLKTVEDWLKNNLLAVGIVSFGTLLLQIITICLAMTLRGQVSDIKRTFNASNRR